MDIAETSMDIVRQFVPDETLETASDKRRSIQWATLNSSTDRVHRQRRTRRRRGRAGPPALEPYSRRRPSSRTSRCPKPESPARGHNCEKCKAIGNGAELAEETGMTRTAASVLELDKQGRLRRRDRDGRQRADGRLRAGGLHRGRHPAGRHRRDPRRLRQGRRESPASAKSAKNTMCRRSPTSAAAAAATGGGADERTDSRRKDDRPTKSTRARRRNAGWDGENR